jgi:hypothetical protein
MSWRARRTAPGPRSASTLLCFQRLYYIQIPEFVIGRPGWDNWLLCYPQSRKVPLASRDVRAVHQNHDCNYHAEGERGVWHGEEAQENYRLHKGRFARLEVRRYVLRSGQLKPHCGAGLTRLRRLAKARLSRYWFVALDQTRGVRHRLGLPSWRAAIRFQGFPECLSCSMSRFSIWRRV